MSLDDPNIPPQGTPVKCRLNWGMAVIERQPVLGSAPAWGRRIRKAAGRGNSGNFGLAIYLLFLMEASHHLSLRPSGTCAWPRIRPDKALGGSWLPWSFAPGAPSPASPDHVLECSLTVLVQCQCQQFLVLTLDLDVGRPEGVCHCLQQRQLG